MTGRRPRLFSFDFSANDDALKLAKALRSALEKMASTKSQDSKPSKHSERKSEHENFGDNAAGAHWSLWIQ